MHYCGGELVSISVSKDAETCCAETGDCCEDKTVHFELEDDYVSPVHGNDFQITELEVLLPILFVLNFDLSVDDEIASVAFFDSSPSPTVQTRLALLQTYLC